MLKFLKKIIKEVISIFLTQQTGNTIPVSLFKFKNKHRSIFRSIYGVANDEEIFKNILQSLNGPIDILMIHSSFNQMIPMYTGNPVKLLSIIKSYCQQQNITLAMPTFFSGSNSQAKEHYKNGKNIFDVRNTISETGILTEVFRRSKDVKRSIHPTHSICCFGPLADKLISNHHLSDTTCGDGTPFGIMIKYHTIILGIGTQIHQALTQVHSAEDILKDEFPITLFSEFIPVTCIDQNGNTLVYNLRIRKQEYIINTKAVYKVLRKKVKTWHYKGIPFLLTRADIVNEAVMQAAKNGQTIYKEI